MIKDRQALPPPHHVKSLEQMVHFGILCWVTEIAGLDVGFPLFSACFKRRQFQSRKWAKNNMADGTRSLEVVNEDGKSPPIYD